MKKLILAGLVIVSVSGVVYASSAEKDCEGVDHLTENLELDQARADEVERILASYKQVKELAKSGRQAEIPSFIEQRQAQLDELLSDEEMQQFKQNVGDWAGASDFANYQQFSGKHLSKQH